MKMALRKSEPMGRMERQFVGNFFAPNTSFSDCPQMFWTISSEQALTRDTFVPVNSSLTLSKAGYIKRRIIPFQFLFFLSEERIIYRERQISNTLTHSVLMCSRCFEVNRSSASLLLKTTMEQEGFANCADNLLSRLFFEECTAQSTAVILLFNSEHYASLFLYCRGQTNKAYNSIYDFV